MGLPWIICILQDSPIKKAGLPAFLHISPNATCVRLAPSTAFPGLFLVVFHLFGFFCLFFRSAFHLHSGLFFATLHFLVSAHGTAFAAASATPARLISSPCGIGATDHTGSGQQAGDAKPSQKLFHILFFHYSLLAIACTLEKRDDRLIPATDRTGIGQFDKSTRISSEKGMRKSTKNLPGTRH